MGILKSEKNQDLLRYSFCNACYFANKNELKLDADLLLQSCASKGQQQLETKPKTQKHRQKCQEICLFKTKCDHVCKYASKVCYANV